MIAYKKKSALIFVLFLLILVNLNNSFAQTTSNGTTETGCVVSDCGPQLGMPNYNCPDGKTTSGPTGRCLRLANGECGWEIIKCPSVACSKPVCDGVYDSGQKDSNGCVIYACPPSNVECSADSPCEIGKCPDSYTYQKFNCINNKCYVINYLIDPCAFRNTCSRPTCKGAYDTGKIDSNGCVIYACPGVACSKPVCDGVYDSGQKDSNGCVIYNCPPILACTACAGGTDTGKVDDKGCHIFRCPTIKCPVDCTCDDAGNVIECSIKISCHSKCQCDNNGNILDCDKSECIDSDGGKNYYEKGKVFVPHSDSTYADVCAYDQKGKQNNDNNLLFEAYCFVDKYGYGYDYYSCPNGCKDGACVPFYEKKEELATKTEKEHSSAECHDEKCKEISNKCFGKDKIIIEECTFYIKSSNKCEEVTNTNSKILKNECSGEENQVLTFCQGCQLDKSTCIPFGTRLEKKNLAYYCDISKNMEEQKNNKDTCQNSYECLSNNCKSGNCKPICEGCINENNACVPSGTRTEKRYCDVDYSFKNQNTENGNCNNNYECSSNLCVNNQCISPSLLKKILDWFKNLFG